MIVATGIIGVLFALISTILLIKCNYHKKILIKLGLCDQCVPKNWTAFSWGSCISKMNIKADVVFFGDSIIRGGNFHTRFRHIKIVNLGSTGDSLAAMIERIDTVVTLSPQKIFLLGGINGLTDFNVRRTFSKYKELVAKLQKQLPTTQIFIHSLLPLSQKKQRQVCKNTTIIKFNQMIQEYATCNNFTFIDLYSHYADNGVLNPILTVDGVHLRPEAYDIWYDKIAGYLE